MSCNGENNFGYVTIEDDKVVSYTGAPEDPEIHKFCNDDFVSAMKLKELVEKRFEECKTNSNGISMKDDWVEYKFQMRLVPELKKLMEDSKK